VRRQNFFREKSKIENRKNAKMQKASAAFVIRIESIPQLASERTDYKTIIVIALHNI
jgi:hypothetical protein